MPLLKDPSKLVTVVACLFCALTSFSSALSSELLFNLQREKINDFKVQLQHTLDGARIRRKRQDGLLTTLSDPGGFTAEHFRVGNSAPEDLPYLFQYNLTTWTSLQHFDRNQVLLGTLSGDLVLLDVTDNKKLAEVVAFNSNEIVIKKARAFSYYGEQWFIFQSAGAVTKIQLYQRVGRGLVARQLIIVSGEFDFDLIEVYGIHYLVVAVYQTSVGQGFTYQGKVLLYQWTNTQFDVIAAKTVQGAKSLACWSMDRTLYIAIGQEIDDHGNMYLGSPIFLFNAKDGASLILQDMIQTRGPKKVSHFSVSGSNYLIFIGRFDAEIYWWSNDQFLLWQSVGNSADASDVSVLALANGEVVLVIVLAEEVLFLTLDLTGHYIVSFTMKFTGFNIKSLQFMFDGRDYYALALFAASIKTHPHPIWKLRLDKYGLPDLTAIDPLIQCLSGLKDRSNERKNELDILQEDLNRVWVTNKELIITAEVVTIGSMSSEQNIIVDEIILNSNVTESSRPKDISSGILDILESVTFINEELIHVMYRTREQEISGTKIFVASVVLPTLNIPSSEYDLSINGVTTSRLSTKTLKKSENQMIDSSFRVNQMSVDQVTTGLLNNINLNDLVLLHGSNNITGNLAFSNVQGTDLNVGTLNGVHVSNFVLKSGDQTLTELKSMAQLNSDSINVIEQTNGEHLRTLQQKVLDLDHYQESKGRYEFKHLLHVNKDLFLKDPINNIIDLEKINLEAVRTDTMQELKDPNIFTSSITVLETVEVTGLINGVDLNRLATVSTEQTLTGNLSFQSFVTFYDHVLTDTVNNIDLYQDAIKRESGSDVNQMKNFESISANNIEMIDYATINDVDISELAISVIKHKGDVVESERSIFKDVVVLGDLTATNGINGYNVSDLPHIAWLKSVSQEIEATVSIPSPVFRTNYIQVVNINGIYFDNFVHTSGDGVVQSEIAFTQDVYVIKNTSIVSGKFLDGVDIESYREENIAYDVLMSEDSIYGNKSFKDLEINGLFRITHINSLYLPNDFMLVNKKQPIDGTKIFTSLVIVDGDVTAKHVSVDQFNGENIRFFFNGAVLRNNSQRISLTDKVFMHIEADALSLSSAGKIDSVLMSDMILRTVTLNTAQYIPAAKVYESMHLSKSAVAGTFNGMHFNSYVNKVVFVDDTANITGKKTFKSLTSAVNMKVNGYVNHIDVILLPQNIFSKTKVNDVNAFIFFGNDLDIESLKVNDLAFIDDVRLNSTVTFNKNISYPIWILSDVKALGDIFVAGLTNGCDLLTVSSYALRTTSNNAQAVMTESFLNMLDVQGNIHVQKVLNDISLEKLKENLIGNGKYQSLAGDFYIQSGISATHVQVLGSLNGLDLPFVISDAVMNSVSQVISGFKIFEQDLEVEVLTGKGNVYVQNSLNNIHIQDLFGKTVWKKEFQIIEGDKVFSLVEAKNATVYGFLNGIKFPQDVVMTAVSEHISSSVFIMKDIHVKLHLYVDGSIGNVNVEQILQNVFWLDRDEDVQSNLIFTEDVTVKGKLNIDGLINNILLETVVRTKGSSVIDGLKRFYSDLVLFVNLDAKSINRYDIEQLVDLIARQNRNETIANVQVFTQPIYSQNTFSVSFFNGMSLPHIQSLFLDKSQEMMASKIFLNQLSNSNDIQLNHQLESLPYQISHFAYFIINQELNIRDLTRILTGFEQKTSTQLYSKSLVTWTSVRNCQQNYLCCDLEYSYWLKTGRSGLVSVESGPEQGRFFPLSNSLSVFKQLVVWTNTTSPWMTWCPHSSTEETTIGFLDSNGHHKVSFTVRNSPSLVDVKAFRDGVTYIIAGYHYDNRNGAYSPSIVYRENELKDLWSEHQLLPIYGALSMDLTTYKNKVLLVIGTGVGTYPEAYSPVYMWNETTRIFDLLQNIPSQYAASVLWIHQNQKLLLAVANLDNFESATVFQCSKKTDGGQINIYSYQNGLIWVQSLRLGGVVSMVSFEIKGETYLVAASRSTEFITVFHWQGYSGFAPLQNIEVRGVNHLNLFWKGEDLYLSVASNSGVSRILKAIIRGNLFKTFTYNDDKSVAEQSDDPSYDEYSASAC